MLKQKFTVIEGKAQQCTPKLVSANKQAKMRPTGCRRAENIEWHFSSVD